MALAPRRRSWPWGKGEREAGEAADHEAPVVAQRGRVGADGEGRRACEEPFERDLGFDTGEGHTDAEVDASAEADVVAGAGPVEIDVVGVTEGVGIAVGGGPGEDDGGAGGEVGAGEAGVAGDLAVVASEGRVDATGLFHEGGDELGLAAEAVLQIGPPGEDAGGGAR
jgi:hypothetical protein